jgi:hypothetical protein
MTTALTVGGVSDLPQLRELGQLLTRSRFFKEDADAAVVKIMLGRELGLGPMASMLEIHVIEGKPSIGSHLIAKGIKRSGRYDYRVLEHTDKTCRIAFLKIDAAGDTKDSLGVFEYTIEDAKKAGLAGKKNWTTSPKGMLFARAIGQGYRVHCPDALDVLCYADGEIEEPEERVIDLGPPNKAAAAKIRVLDPVRDAFPGQVVDVVGSPRPTTASPTTSSSPSGGPTSSPSAPTSSAPAPGGSPPSPPARAVVEPDVAAPAAPAASSAGECSKRSDVSNPTCDAHAVPPPPAGVVPSPGSTPPTPTGSRPRRAPRRDA